MVVEEVEDGYKGSNSIKLDVEKFDGLINFGLWQIQVKKVLIQYGLIKAPKGRIGKLADMDNDSWDDLDMRTASQIWLLLAKNVLANVSQINSAKEL
ncbi:hypothetical protein BVC80_1231g7 [Macleaya cordata]|uniref:Uncharacterized protein n=1 Tax=Macleaya cordata TaxID=56857 RepID=A0A200R2B4_MACCD|nr:hypothetical protein BVC80_1231g7 [Macleaya cordata]